jgi:DNA polymerase I-like protein with 3'-5' exonuclease and polymerase domains
LSLSLETIDGGRLSYLLDLFELEPAALAPIWEALAEKELVGHNLLFDLSFLTRLGFIPGKLWDTMLASQVLGAGVRTATNAPLGHSLQELAERHLGEQISKAEQMADWSKLITPAMLTYTAADAELPVRLREVMEPAISAAKLGPVVELEMRALPTVVWAAVAGVAVDRGAWQAIAAAAKTEATTLRERLDAEAPNAGDLFGGRNWNSPDQVKTAFADLGIGLESTDDNALAAVDHPLAGLVREYRVAEKRAGTYGVEWLKHVAPDGRVYW